MNYLLSVYANRTGKKSGYVLLANGTILTEKVSKFNGDNIKENALHQINLGLLECRSILSHNDILVIEVQNVHLCNWLNGMVEYKEYSSSLDKIFAVLELLDCRYKFVFSKKSFAKDYLANKQITGVKVSSVDDLMSEFE